VFAASCPGYVDDIPTNCSGNTVPLLDSREGDAR